MQSAEQAREADPSLGGQAVDQGARAVETIEIIPTSDEVVDDLRKQMADLDVRDKEKDAEIVRERDRATVSERARVDAENRARQSDNARATAEQTAGRSVDVAQLDLIKNSLAGHESELTSLASKKANLNAEGNFEEAAKLDAQMAKIGGRIAQLETGQAELEAKVKAPPADAGRQPDQQQQQPSADQQRESYINSQPPRVQDWLRSENGKRFFADAGFRDKVAAAADYATKVKGIAPDSPQYIEYVEEQIGLRQPAETPPPRRDDRQPSLPAQGRDAGQRMTTAPAGGSSAGSVRTNANGTIEVYLTEGEREMGRRQGSTDAELAAAKRQLIQEGLIGPTARNR